MKKILDCNCTACAACYSICPKSCISMIKNGEGFLYPHINDELCTGCGLCEKICPVLNDYAGNNEGKAYACINNDTTIRLNSSSGGVFTLLSEYIIDKGGVVFGAAYDYDLSVQHIPIFNKQDICKLRGSKYLQSKIGDTYIQVKGFLDEGKTVLFTGTPCQISGLRSYLRREYDNLFLQDIICHGVPSPKLWEKYLEYGENKYGKISETEKPCFRNKKFGWRKYSVAISYNNKKIVEPVNRNQYMTMFLNNWCLRFSCYDCHSKSLNRESDITLADFWGVDKVAPKFDDNKGTSLVLVNSKKGQQLFDEIKEHMRYTEVDLHEAIKYNPSAYKSVGKPSKRKDLFEMLTASAEVSFDKIRKSLFKGMIVMKVKRRIKGILKMK